MVIVNQALARGLFPGRSPIGRRLSVGRHLSRQNLEIVGVVADSRYRTLKEPALQIAYLSFRQLAEFRQGANLVLEVRTAAIDAIRREVRSLDREVALSFQTLDARIADSLVAERTMAALSTFFALVVLLLASIGLYALIAGQVSRRTNEIGVRLALGSSPGEVVRMVLRDSLALILAGLGLGIGGVMAAGRVLESYVFGVTATDPATVVVAAAALAASGLLAALLPARRAATVDPMTALRVE